MTTKKIRTRFAPSPTGFIHLGNIRSALYPWAFARANGGEFILRIEDTDAARSTQAAVDVILQSMQWLQLDIDQAPVYQMQRMPRYKEVLAQLQAQGHIYPCYMGAQELDALRQRQMENKEKPRYDGTWRPEPGKVLPAVPAGAQPVLRFKTPTQGSVGWDDQCKGRIAFDNSELDDLIVARVDGTPTYNFCVCVDDMDMGITHVIRGDDHINNTPRQIHIFQALGAPVPVFAHLPTVLGENGEKMSKRSGAKAVTQYRNEGFLPDALLNYLARLGWSHGDDEIFSRAQFLQWFDLEHLGRSAAQFDEAKLRWVNAQHLKNQDDAALATLLVPFLPDVTVDARLPPICALFKERCETLVDLAQWARRFYTDPITPDPEDLARHVNAAARAALHDFVRAIQDIEWSRSAIAAAIKQVLQARGLKMPQLAMPLRVLTLGVAHTPAVDAVLHLMGRERVIARLQID